MLYIPLYLGGIAYIRSFVWFGSFLGLVAMAAAVFF
ncbi:MAPEG family protein [Rhizobium alarense]